MEITWLGHSCFKIKGKSGTIITDPFDSNSGYKLGKTTADIVTVSHDHPGHNYADGIGGNPKVIIGPGEYDIAGIFIYGVRTYHDTEKGTQKGKNTSYLIEIDDLRICHLGDLGHVLSPQQVEELGKVEVVLAPVGGVTTIDAKIALEVARLLRPGLVIPMHYYTEATPRFEPVDNFLKEMGSRDMIPQPKLVVTRSNLPAEMQVSLLECCAQSL